MELLNINPVYLLVEFGDIIKPICIFVVLPIVLFLLHLRYKRYESEKRTEIVMAAIEKNGDIDVQEFFKNLNKPKKSVREKMILQLHWELLLGGIFTIFGLVVFIALGVLIGFGITKGDDVIAMSCCLGIPALALGAGLLIAYFSGKKMLKELKD
jgi:hypothetical protein